MTPGGPSQPPSAGPSPPPSGHFPRHVSLNDSISSSPRSSLGRNSPRRRQVSRGQSLSLRLHSPSSAARRSLVVSGAGLHSVNGEYFAVSRQPASRSDLDRRFTSGSGASITRGPEGTWVIEPPQSQARLRVQRSVRWSTDRAPIESPLLHDGAAIGADVAYYHPGTGLPQLGEQPPAEGWALGPLGIAPVPNLRTRIVRQAPPHLRRVEPTAQSGRHSGSFGLDDMEMCDIPRQVSTDSGALGASYSGLAAGEPAAHERSLRHSPSASSGLRSSRLRRPLPQGSPPAPAPRLPPASPASPLRASPSGQWSQSFAGAGSPSVRQMARTRTQTISAAPGRNSPGGGGRGLPGRGSAIGSPRTRRTGAL
eukprot:TRINITY_DN17810_c0_g1_i9.p1 TRINITY_DN17810_c0_g1~~TRINITY_DN17810_c0_g1_i9.p1  ORF type:complete len:397 (+),score=38.77 TRINITY_DN17810_c0_g1_i9:91-1191(+)